MTLNDFFSVFLQDYLCKIIELTKKTGTKGSIGKAS